MRLACCGDSHLSEKASAGGKLVVGPDGRSIRAADRERCLMAVADGAVEHGADIVLHSGDLFDVARPTPREYVIAEAFIDRICGAGTPLVAVACNHGLPQSPLEAHALAPLIGRHPNLHILLRPEVIAIRTQVGLIDVAALPWPQRSTLAAKDELAGLAPEALNALISEKLGLVIHSLLARRTPGVPLVLLGHLMLREAVFSNEETAPDTGQIMLSAEDLTGFDAAILGDIHRAQSFGEGGRIFYTGSTDRCSFGEEAEAKGWWLVTLDGKRFGKEQIETPARRYVTYSPDRLVFACESPDACEYDLDTLPVFRCKGKVSQEEYDNLSPLLARWRQIPTFSEQLEITRTTRARAEEMTGDLSPEAAIRLWHETNTRGEELGELLEAHRGIGGAQVGLP